MSDLQIAMRAAKIDHIRATRRFGAFAVLTLRTIEKIRAGRITASEAARHFEQMARSHQLRETGHYDPRLVDILITRVRQASRLLTKLSVFLTERHTKNRQRYGARTTLGRVLPPSYTPAHAPGLALSRKAIPGSPRLLNYRRLDFSRIGAMSASAGHEQSVPGQVR